MCSGSMRYHHRHHSSGRSRSRSYSSPRSYTSGHGDSYYSSYRQSSGGYSSSYPSYSDAPFRFGVFLKCRADTRRYESAYYGGYSYDNNSFAGAHLKDIQWDMNQLIKFEKNFYHVRFVSLLLDRNIQPSRRCPTRRSNNGAVTIKSFVKARTSPNPCCLSMFLPSQVVFRCFS